MKQNLLLFQTFSTYDRAKVVADALEANGILTDIVQNTRRLDATIIGQSYDDKFILSIPAEDFTRANELLNNLARVNADDISSDDPLQVMNNAELLDIVAKPDEWGIVNYNVALALLKKRNVPIPEGSLTQMEEKRISVLSERKPMQPLLLVLGYMSCLLHFLLVYLKYSVHSEPLYSWYFPGIFGLLLGAIILQSKTTLPNGQRIATFDERTIKHGKALLLLSAVSWLGNIVLFLFSFL
jgi:hypothetical protein